MDPLLLAAILLFATFSQTVTGFGSGLISMAALASLLDIHVTVPLVAVCSIAIEVGILARFRHAFNLRSVIQLSVASVIAVPLGVALLDVIDQTVFLRLLGVLITGYAAYALLRFRLPTIQHPAWAYGFGFFGGLLGGMYNVSGPPVVIYGTCRCWSPNEFRSNLQGFFLINNLTAVAAHAVNQNYTPAVWQHFLVALPAIGVGLLLGFVADRYVNAGLFRTLVFVLLAVLGVRMIFSV